MSTSWKWALGGLAVLSALAAGCQKEPLSLTGEFYLFSGSSPPQWLIADDEIAALRDRLSGLPGATRPAEFMPFGQPAYGLVSGTDSPDFPDRLWVAGGIIETQRGTTFEQFSDEKKLFDFLEESADRAGVFQRAGSYP